MPETPEPTESSIGLNTLDLDRLIPITHLVLEGFDASTLTAWLGDDEVFLDGIGRRCVTETRAAAMFSERAAAQARQRERDARTAAQHQARSNETRDWVRAIQAAQKDNPGVLYAEDER